MGEESEISRTSVRYNGIFDFNILYRTLHDLISSMGYFIEEPKFKLRDTKEGNEIEIEWNAFKKVDDYTQFLLWVRIFIVGEKQIEVQKGDVKTKMNRGDVEITIKSKLKTDYADKWEKHPLLKFFKGIYDRYIYKPTYESWEDKVWADMFTLENEAKAFFGLPRFM